jgi:hypothetical protein
LEKPEGGDHVEDLVIDGRIILEWILGKHGGMFWQALVKTVMNLRVS